MHDQSNGVLQRVIGGISLVFYDAYAGAQLVAGGKALHVLFEWPSWAGAVMGSVLVMLYCCAGGIRASIWTDAAQSAVMVMTMGLLLIVAVQLLGGTASAVAQMRQVDGFLDWFPTNTALLGLSGGVLFALSWLFAGLAVIGQPHIMVRFMTLMDSGKCSRQGYGITFGGSYLTHGTRCGGCFRVFILATLALLTRSLLCPRWHCICCLPHWWV